MFKVRAYRAIDEPATCQEYMRGHVNVLIERGISHITSNNQEWLTNPNVYCVIATDESGEMVGGIRVQVADGTHRLPLEDAIGDVEPKVYDLVRRLANETGVGELCGLWNSKKVKQVGLSVVLTRAAISIVNQLPMKTMVGICGIYTLQMFTNVGFVVNKGLGHNGEFVYPTEQEIARAVGILNALSLDTAASYDKERMTSLRNNPKQVFIETGPKGSFKVQYNLTLVRVTANVLPESYTL